MTRPSWSDYFLQLADIAASRSTCPRLSVGAVLVLDQRVLATGYNGLQLVAGPTAVPFI